MNERLTANRKRQVFTTTQAAGICGVTQQTVIKWIDSGRLAGYKVPNSRARRVTRTALIDFMRANNIPESNLEKDVIKVLVVDDEEMIADMIALEFEEDRNIEVRKVNRGFDAGIVAEYRPDVIILDIMLPDIDGRRVCRLIRDGAMGKEVKIIGVSGYAHMIHVDDMLRKGFDEFLPKPFTPSQIREVVLKHAP